MRIWICNWIRDAFKCNRRGLNTNYKLTNQQSLGPKNRVQVVVDVFSFFVFFFAATLLTFAWVISVFFGRTPTVQQQLRLLLLLDDCSKPKSGYLNCPDSNSNSSNIHSSNSNRNCNCNCNNQVTTLLTNRKHKSGKWKLTWKLAENTQRVQESARERKRQKH